MIRERVSEVSRRTARRVGEEGMPVTPHASHELLFRATYPKGKLRLPASFHEWTSDRDIGRRAKSLFVLCSSSRLESVSQVVTQVNKRHALKLLLVYSDTDPTWLPQIMERADLRAVRNMVVHSDIELPMRVLRAWELGAQDSLIAKAMVVKNRLLLVTCSARQYDVSFEDLPSLKRIPIAERENFELAEDGSYIHWPEPDIHLDVDAIRASVDPEWRNHVLAQKLTHDRRYGAAVRSLRESSGLTQAEIVSLSERQVRRIEAGEGFSTESLRRYAEALKLKFPQFLSKVAELTPMIQG